MPPCIAPSSREVEKARQQIQQKEAALRKSEEKYRRIVETAGEGFILMDQNLGIVDVNDAYCQMLGFARDEILGKNPFDLATEEFRQFLLTNRDELLSRDYREFEGTVVARDVRHIPILLQGNTLRDDRGDIIGNMTFVSAGITLILSGGAKTRTARLASSWEISPAMV